MYSNNSPLAVGFSGLRHYVTDIEDILSRCRSGIDRMAQDQRALGQDSLDQTLIGELSVESGSREPSLVYTDFDHLSQTDTGEHVFFDEPESSVIYAPSKSKSSTLPAFLSIAAIIITGGLTVALMQYMEKNKAPLASESLVQLVEEAPPIGRGLVLNPAQIRYCIAQGIRLGGAAENKDSLSKVSQNHLQSMRTDYDNRCAEYRFQAGAFDDARRHVESLRADLQHEGVAMLASLEQSSSQGSVLQQSQTPEVGAMRDDGKLQQQALKNGESVSGATRADDAGAVVGSALVFDNSPSKFIKDVQWRLYKLKYYSGPIDGLDSVATQNALRGFFSVHTEAADATEERVIFRAIDKIYEQRN